MLDLLISPEGRELWSEESSQDWPSERRFHAALLDVASAGLKQLLHAIDAYERFSRFLQDAFDDVLLRLSQNQQRTKPSELARLPGVKRAAKGIPKSFVAVAESLAPFGEAVRFQESYSSLAERLSDSDWLERLLEHHCRVQQSKPPAGKALWFDRFDDGSCMIRTGYIRDIGGRHDDSYVHAYRTASLWSFARDLRLVK